MFEKLAKKMFAIMTKMFIVKYFHPLHATSAILFGILLH